MNLQNLNPAESHQSSREVLLELLRAYQTAIDINIISSVTNKDGIILYANNKFCEVSKYQKNELVGKNHNIINSGFHPKEFFQSMWKTISSGQPWQGEIKNKAKDSSFYWVDTVILPIRTSDGSTIQYLSLRTLITEKKVAEQQRQEYAEKLKEMLHMTSHRVRAPLARCLGILNLVEDSSILNEKELQTMVVHLKTSAQELDNFTRELTEFMDEIEKKYRRMPETHIDESIKRFLY